MVADDGVASDEALRRLEEINAQAEAEMARPQAVEFFCAADKGNITWRGTTNHTAVLLSPTVGGGLGRVGLEFTDDIGRRVMVFPGANDALIVTTEQEKAPT